MFKYECLILIPGLWLLGAIDATAQTTATELLERSYFATRHQDSSTDMTMTLSNRSGQTRERGLHLYSKLKPDGHDLMTTLVFRSPADIRGTATLLIQQSGREDDMWVYLPSLKKTRRLLSDNKRDAFVGSDLSYGDILGHKPADWNARILREDNVDGVAVFVVEATPKSETVKRSSGYSKRELWIGKTNFVALRTDYWDDSDTPLKTISVRDVRTVEGGRVQFMKVDAINHQSGHRTALILDNFKAAVGLSDALFGVAVLERGE